MITVNKMKSVFRLNSFLGKWIAIPILAGGLLSACEAHDYWLLSETLTVDSSQEIYKVSNSEDIAQDLFVRYQLDYELENTNSSQSTEVVVSATSYVNGFERATGHKVWHLDPSQKVEGILMTNQLELGNKLIVSLECCNSSMCTNKEVLCLSDDEFTSVPDTASVAEFCYDSCESTDECLKTCAAESECKDLCQDEDGEEDESCRKEYCGLSGPLDSCDYLCNHEENCLASCEPTRECQADCMSLRASCFMNCLATWNRCEDEAYQPDTDIIPCALCGGEGSCKINLNTKISEEWSITSTEGTTYPCNLECQNYPSECVTGCEALYEGKKERMDCMDLCLQQQLFWCNDFMIPMDYVDSRGKQPCCFETACQGSLNGVVKSYDVECFNDTSCSSDKTCSSEGICVSKGTGSSCQAMPLSSNTRSGICWILLLFAGYGIHRRGARKSWVK